MKDVLDSQRTRIRPWRHLDVLAQEAWPPYDDPAQVFWHIPRSLSLADADALWSSDQHPTRYIWAVENLGGALIGRISLREVDLAKGAARLGISMGSPFVSKGLGTEALIVFLDHCFGQLGFRTIVLDVAAPNRRAVQCYERLGFHHVGGDWRSPSRNDDLSFLDSPAYRDISIYIKRGRHGVWVQFYEMSLTAVQRQERQSKAHISQK